MKRIISICTASTVPAIRDLRIHRPPTDKAIEVKKLARHCRTTVYLATDGNLYSEGVRSSGSYPFGRGVWDDYLGCIQKLGVITRAQLREHLRAATQRDQINRRARQIIEFVSDAEKLGIVLTKKQLRQLKP